MTLRHIGLGIFGATLVAANFVLLFVVIYAVSWIVWG